MIEPNGFRPGARVGLLVTCLADLLRPTVGFASATLLEQSGCVVGVPEQGCCGQPNFNGGDTVGARSMARAIIKRFTGFDYVVVPSGSCAAMLRIHYPELFVAGSADHQRAQDLAERTWELTSFLHDVVHCKNISAQCAAKVVVHDSCSGLRELGISEQPRALLQQVTGVNQQQLENPDVCCGFGGMFCVKYPEISNRMAEKKIADIRASADAVDVLVSIDLGCLLHLAGKLRRDGVAIKALHIAELLAGMTHADSAAESL